MTDNSPTDRRDSDPSSRRETFRDVGDADPATESSDRVSASPGDPDARPSTDRDTASEIRASETDSPAHRADATADDAATRSEPSTPAAPASDSAPTVAQPVVTEHPVAQTPPASTPNYSDTSPFGVERGSASTTTPQAQQATPPPVAPATVQQAPAPAATAAPDSTRTAEAKPNTSSNAVPANSTGEQRTVYIETPQPPKKKSNRGIGVLIALAATVVFAIVWAAVAVLIIAVVTPGDRVLGSFTEFALSPAYWTPIAAFFVGLVLLVLVLNRGGWPWYIIGGLVVAVIVYGGYLLGALLTVAQQITPSEVDDFLARNSISPLAIGAGLAAREVSIWAGAAIAARGRRVKARNAEERAAFDKADAERKAEYERARSGAGVA